MMLCRVLNCRMFGMLNFENTVKSKSFMLGAVNSKVILTLIYFTRVIRTLFTKQFHRFYDEFPHSWGHLQLLFSSWHTVVRLWDPHQKISVHTVEWSTGCGAALFGVALRKEWRHIQYCRSALHGTRSGFEEVSCSNITYVTVDYEFKVIEKCHYNKRFNYILLYSIMTNFLIQHIFRVLPKKLHLQ